MLLNRREFLSRSVAGIGFAPNREPVDGRAAAAHLVRRTAMSSRPDVVNQLADMSRQDMIGRVLEQSDGADDEPSLGEDDWYLVVEWWLGKMTNADTGLTDRMAWFWHSLLTTNAWKVPSAQLVADQLTMFRSLGRTDFPTVLAGFVGSGALLTYLDASDSTAANPNENLGRELMELYTIGRGSAHDHYSQDDVRAAARALAGWVVDDRGPDGMSESDDVYRVRFDRRNAFVAPLVFQGVQADWNTETIVDHLAHDPRTASRVAGLLWKHLVGFELDSASSEDLGRWWSQHDMAIDPLVERILSTDEFWGSAGSRPRSGLEWFTFASSATGLTEDSWFLERLEQVPYLPPSPAGWNDGQWLRPGSLAARSAVAHSMDLADLAADHSTMTLDDSVDQIIDRCGLHPVSQQTLAALRRTTPDSAPDHSLNPEGAAAARWRLALTCPEAQLS